ncbi:hypothetical protein RND71_005579 [Anisodus tanguticus]|uniref:Uncharacterized protein n=1 Tax=Anisodus tanguticus TaxID=243964 RepID=A0AAE1VMT9_9SOLA|nr:hypothetical protein RND71_005579 [Anisodus tanguticus]
MTDEERMSGIEMIKKKLDECFKFSIEPEIVGEVKLCSYSELQKITDLKPQSLIQKTLSGTLFHGTIDKMELLTNEKANTHPNLVKLYTFCWDTRLAAVYDEEFTRVLPDVLLADHFGWDDRINVATQLADLFAWFHGKRIAIGSVTPSCLMIDEVEFEPLVVFSTFYFSSISEDS